MYIIKSSEKTLKFDNTEVNKKEFCKSKQPNDSNLVNVGRMVISDKFRHNDDGFKYFIGYKNYNIIRPLCIILSQMSGYTKYFENEGKNMSFNYDNILVKYNETWNKIKDIGYKISQHAFL